MRTRASALRLFCHSDTWWLTFTTFASRDSKLKFILQLQPTVLSKVLNPIIEPLREIQTINQEGRVLLIRNRCIHCKFTNKLFQAFQAHFHLSNTLKPQHWAPEHIKNSINPCQRPRLKIWIGLRFTGAV